MLPGVSNTLTRAESPELDAFSPRCTVQPNRNRDQSKTQVSTPNGGRHARPLSRALALQRLVQHKSEHPCANTSIIRGYDKKKLSSVSTSWRSRIHGKGDTT